MDENRKTIVRYSMVCLAICAFAVGDAKLADYMNLCTAKSPELSQCLVTSAQQLVEKMKKGIPEFDLEPIDPLMVPLVDFRKAGMGLTLVIRNSSHSGFGAIKFTDAKADPSNYQFEFHTLVPKHSVRGTYSVDGRIMMLPIQGEGNSHITLHNVTSVWKIQGEPFKKNGTTYMRVKHFDVTVVPHLMELKFENLFNGNKMLGDSLNEVLNSQWEDLYKHVKPALEKTESETLTELSQKLFSQIPYEDLFLK